MPTDPTTANSQKSPQLAYLLDFSPTIIYCTVPSGDFRITFISNNLRDILGYAPQEIYADDNFWYDHIHPDDRTKVFGKLATLFTQDWHIIEYRFQHKRGHYLWLHDQIRVIRDDNGDVINVVGSMTDVSERRKADRLIKTHHARMQAIFDTAQDGIVTIDAHGVIQACNPSAAAIFGCDEADFVGKNIRTFMPEGVAAEHDGYLQRFVQTREARLVGAGPREVIACRKDGGEFPIEMSINNIQQAGEDTFLAIFRDISARKRNEKELQEAQKLQAVGQLAGGIAHEINTPSQYISDNLKFLADAHEEIFSLLSKSLNLADAVRGREGVSKLVEQVDAAKVEIDFDYLRQEIPSAVEQSLLGITQVSQIVLAMREFSHPGTGDKMPTDVNAALENAIMISRSEWKHNAQLTTEFAGDLPALPSRAGELNQVFLNLIINASHAITENQKSQGAGLIKISTAFDDQHVIVRVTDNGAGIPLEVQDQIFNPFFTTKEVGQGTGQGLSISHDIVVKKHGGTITFDTLAGEGTTFVVKLPIVAA